MDRRNLGADSVAGLVLRLAVISLIVGVVLAALGINANNLFSSLNILARRIYDLGFSSIEWVLQYILVGAMVVVPIWLVAWLLGGLRARRE